MSRIYEFSAKRNGGEEISLEDYRGKVMLIVNTASKCGFTPQYKGLQKLHEEYGEQVAILAFPCNQFGKQEPGNNEEIKSFCELNYGVSFPLFAKVDVNGSDAHPLFEYLKGELPGLLGSKRIKWNFTKFLVDGEGKPVKRFGPKDEPSAIGEAIKELL